MTSTKSPPRQSSNRAVEIPKLCKAGVCTDIGPNFKLTVEDVPVPNPGRGELLIRLRTTGVCFSDVHYMLDDLGGPSMADFGVRSPGHEGAGIVVKLGEDVRGWKVGDRAGVKPVWSVCHSCDLCWGKHETHCTQSVITGKMVPGTYQQYIVSPAIYTTPIPDGVDDFVAGPIMCSGSTIYRSLMESELRSGQWAVFFGAGGGVGHMGVQLARAMGLRVIGVDGGSSKRDLCLRLGCEAFIDFLEIKDVEKEIVRITDSLGAHAVFVTASSKVAYANAIQTLRVGGKVMCIGLPPVGTAVVGGDPNEFIFKNLHVIGTLVGSMQDTHEALQFAAQGLLKPIYEKFPISELPEAVEKLRSGKIAGRCVIDFDSSDGTQDLQWNFTS